MTSVVSNICACKFSSLKRDIGHDLYITTFLKYKRQSATTR
jgi:hypothetical protein